MEVDFLPTIQVSRPRRQIVRPKQAGKLNEQQLKRAREIFRRLREKRSPNSGHGG